MGLFDKKYCDICGEKIRFLSNRKLEDGNLCKDCAEKLSPWFSERRHSTVSDIQAQLSDREENRQRVSAFHADQTLGEGNLLCIDNEKGQFLVRRRGEALSNNPDVLNIGDVAQCDLEIEDSKTEEKQRDSEGKMVSYNPPRYTYRYNFFLSIRVNHAYLDEIRFRVNSAAVEIKTGLPAQRRGNFALVGATLADDPRPQDNEDYQRYQAMGAEMRSALLDWGKPAQASPAPTSGKVRCPACSAVIEPDATGCCPYCGTKLI